MADKAKTTSKRGRWTGTGFAVSKKIQVSDSLGAMLKEMYPRQADAAIAVREFINLNITDLQAALERRLNAAELEAAKEQLRGLDPGMAALAMEELHKETVEAAEGAD